jgi:hypothetical protein
LADEQVLSTPPASVQLVEPELITSTQFSVCALDGEQMTKDPSRASAPALPTRPNDDLIKSKIILKSPVCYGA